jgi:hypothetical protein
VKVGDYIPPSEPVVWKDFVALVLEMDRFINCNTVWRKDFSAPAEPPTCPPTFEFRGWRVYKPR